MAQLGGNRSKSRAAGGAATRDGSGVHVSPSPRTRDQWLSELTRSGAPISDAVEALLDAHLRLQDRYADLRLQHRALSSTVDRLPLGVFVVSDLKIISSNLRGRAIIGHGLVVEDNELLAERDDERMRLAAEMRLAARIGSTRALVVERSRGKPLQVVVFPVGSDDPGLMVVAVGDPSDTPAVAESLYRGLFGLTPTEARVAAELVMGRAPREISQVLEVGVETTRTHVKHILGKMDCHRQVDVVRKLVLSPALLTGTHP